MSKEGAPRSGLMEAVQASGHDGPRAYFTSTASRKKRREKQLEFRERLAGQTICFTSRQIAEFEQHRLTAIAIPVNLAHFLFIDLKLFMPKPKQGKKPIFPLNVWVAEHIQEGIVVAIASQNSDHQPPRSALVLNSADLETAEGICVKFWNTQHDNKNPFNTELTVLHTAKHYRSKAYREEQG